MDVDKLAEIRERVLGAKHAQFYCSVSCTDAEWLLDLVDILLIYAICDNCSAEEDVSGVTEDFRPICSRCWER